MFNVTVKYNTDPLHLTIEVFTGCECGAKKSLFFSGYESVYNYNFYFTDIRNYVLPYMKIYMVKITDRHTDKLFILLSHVHDIQGITY